MTKNVPLKFFDEWASLLYSRKFLLKIYESNNCSQYMPLSDFWVELGNSWIIWATNNLEGGTKTLHKKTYL